MDTDRNLLFGVLALQADLLDNTRFAEACAGWAARKGTPLADLLVERGWLTPQDRSDVERLLERKLKKHGGDAHASLAAVAGPAARRALGSVSDADVERSLAGLPPGDAPAPDQLTIDVRQSAGRYRVLRPHALGGLGEVLVAEDTELHREIALKQIQQRHADQAESRARFLLEAEVTGGLEHPGIVPVYGLGTYDDGRPYYAMRFIRGDSLKDAIARFHQEKATLSAGQRTLRLRQLLGQFVDVCNAVAYAHSRGVLHRDLKPANVMLGKYGETLVVDWGLAKVLGGTAAEVAEGPLRLSVSGDSTTTQAGAALGTPAYMSPEQAAGKLDQLGPASDVYSLGATLYCVLTGQAPYPTGDVGQVLGRVQKGDYTPPRQLDRTTPPALEAICVKAMARQPRDRYPTPNALAADLEKWLADEPVTAYREPWSQRLARWERRNRTTIVAGAVLLVTAVVALATSNVLVWREQRQTAEQYRRAEENLRRAGVLAGQLLDLSEKLAQLEQSEVQRKELTETAIQSLRFLLAQHPDDRELRVKAAKIYRYAANVRSRLNEIPIADEYYQEAVRISRELIPPPADQGGRLLEAGGVGEFHTVLRDRLAETLRDYAGFLTKTGRLTEADEALREAFGQVEKLRNKYPQPFYQRTLASCLLAQANIDYARGRYAETVPAARQAADLYRGLLDAPPEMSLALDGLFVGLALNRLAAAQRQLGHLEEALSANAATLDQARALLDQDKANNDFHNLFGLAQREKGSILARLPGRQAEAEESLGQAIRVWDDLQKRFKYPRDRESQALAFLERGQLRAARNESGPAAEDFEKARGLLETLVTKAPLVTGYTGPLGRVYAELGRLALARGETAAAVDWLTRARDTLRTTLGRCPECAPEQRALREVEAELEKVRARLP
jgi:serine/threonine-protein kinase